MIDLVWNFPLLQEQQAIWSEHLAKAMEEYRAMPVEIQRPSFRSALDATLRERAGKWLGFPAARTWLVCGNHHGTLLSLLVSGLAGQRVAVEAISYPGFLNQCRLTRTEMVGIAIDGDGMLPDALRSACEQGRAEGKPIRGLFTMANVQNPMGFVTSLERREALVAIAREFDLTIIVDEAYGYLEEHVPTNYAVLAPERTYFVQGLAKSFAPGSRTGFLVAPESAAEAIAGAIVCLTTGTDVPQNMAALALCEDGTLDRLMADKRTEGAARNTAARALLAAAGYPSPAGAACAWHLWLPLPERLDPADVVAAMAQVDVLLSSGKFCEVTPGAAHGVRLALGGEVERERTLEGVKRLAEYLRSV